MNREYHIGMVSAYILSLGFYILATKTGIPFTGMVVGGILFSAWKARRG